MIPSYIKIQAYHFLLKVKHLGSVTRIPGSQVAAIKFEIVKPKDRPL